MSTGAPPDTDSWTEAVTEGYYGINVDDKPADYYTVQGEGGGGGAPAAAITTVTPPSLPANAPVTTVTIKGTGLTTAYSVEIKYGVGQAAGGTPTVVDDSTLTVPVQGPGAGNGGVGTIRVMMLSGEYTNELPWEFTAEAARDFQGSSPDTVSLAAAGSGFTLTGTGSFPDAAGNLKLNIAQPNMGGVTIESASVTKDSETQITGHFANAATMVEGSAQVYVWIVDENTAYPGSDFVTFTA